MATDKTTLQKYTFLLKEFSNAHNKTLTAYDEHLIDELGGLDPKSIGRLLDELEAEFPNIEKFMQGKRKAYKLIKPIDVLEEALGTHGNLGILFSMVNESDPDMLQELEHYTKKANTIYRFISSPFEDLLSIEQKDIFRRIKTAVEYREYRKIKFIGDKEAQDNLKCLKLVFVDGNWYLVYINSEDLLKLGRINFIESVEYASKMETFQLHLVKDHLNFIDNELQNSLTLYGEEKKTALIKATPLIAKYFKEDMKKFLSSQKFIKELEDGSVIFTLEYTQALEILPFIQKWMPDLTILEPQELKEKFIRKLQSSINNHN